MQALLNLLAAIALLVWGTHTVRAGILRVMGGKLRDALAQGLPDDLMLLVLVGALLTVVSYSSLAMVLLTAALVKAGVLTLPHGLGLVLGANLGSGIIAWMSLAGAPPEARRIPIGNFAFKLVGCLLAAPFLGWLTQWAPAVQAMGLDPVVAAHLLFNLLLTVSLIGFTEFVARRLETWLPAATHVNGDGPRHLDPTALSTPSLAIACAAREALHLADVVETMLRGVLPVIRSNDAALAERLRRMDDTVDSLYSAIKFYLTQISREALSEQEGRRWADIMSFTINMEQVGDIVERILQDLEDKKIAKGRSFSEAGQREIEHLHERLMANLHLGMSVFLDGNLANAKTLLEEKVAFRDLEREYASRHIVRLPENTPQSIGTSSLHIDMLSDLKRINSHICSMAYPILEQAGALANTRLLQQGLLRTECKD